jgi:3-phosphoshikimate 1-carboxyvinyltransferase
MFANGRTRIRHVGHIRHKETDRIAAIIAELAKLGISAAEEDDGLTIDGNVSASLKPATIDTYNDHRMAMSFALAGLRAPGVRISNPSCVAKTYPLFFDDLNALVRGVRYNRSASH